MGRIYGWVIMIPVSYFKTYFSFRIFIEDVGKARSIVNLYETILWSPRRKFQIDFYGSGDEALR